MPCIGAGTRISIHAPLTGSDDSGVLGDLEPEISIHAPLTGSDIQIPLYCGQKNISIHAPLTGSDRTWLPFLPAAADFNPRSPYGERQQDCTKFYLGFCLSSTIL